MCNLKRITESPQVKQKEGDSKDKNINKRLMKQEKRSNRVYQQG